MKFDFHTGRRGSRRGAAACLSLGDTDVGELGPRLKELLLASLVQCRILEKLNHFFTTPRRPRRPMQSRGLEAHRRRLETRGDAGI